MFLLACMSVMFFFFAAGWLHTYNAFTREKTVAELRISEQKEDELGEYFEVEITPIENDQTAFSRLFVGEEDPNPIRLETTTYKLYGDILELGGPILKFKNELILLNFETAYKFNYIRTEYESDDEAEDNRTDEMTDRYRIGEADTTYRSIADSMRDETFTGNIYKFFFDSEPQRKLTGIFITNDPVEGELVIRNDGFHWVQKSLDD